MSNSAGASSSTSDDASFPDESSELPVPDGVRTSISSDTLVYEPSSPPQRVVVPQSADDAFVTLTGLAQTGGAEAKGPDAGTLPENLHGAGTERYQVALYPVGPLWRRLDQVAVFAHVGSGLMSNDGRHGPVGGHELKTVSPVWMEGRLGVFIQVNIVAMGTIPCIQFQITCTGVVDEMDPLPRETPASDADPPPSSFRYGSSQRRFESDDDRYDPFERDDRNRPFDDRDFER